MAMAKSVLRRIFRRPRSRAGNIAEFAPCLFVFFMFALFPLINLIMLGANCGTVALLTRNAAVAAANAPTYGQALTAMQSSVNNDLSAGFGQFSKLTANGGYNNTGVDLYVVATSIGGGATQVYGPDTVLTVTPNTSNFIYEYRVVSSFSLQPFINMSAVPFIGSVPVIGAATPFGYSAERAVEDATGLGSLGLASTSGSGPNGPSHTGTEGSGAISGPSY